MTEPEIRVIDPRDEAALRAWWEVGRDATADRPVDAWKPWSVARRALAASRTDGRVVLVAAVDDGHTVGAGSLFLHRHDNTHLGDVDVHVVPAYRRRGIGRALLAELESQALHDGRTTLTASAFAPTYAESPGTLFAAACGYPVASAELTKVVDLRTAPAAWPALDAEVAVALGGYRVVAFDGPVPDEHVEDFCRLLSTLVGEVPTGDLDLRRARWTARRLRDHEARMRAVDRAQVIAVAVAPDGHLCGFSDIRVHRADPRHATVGATLVMPGHRGHRLGLAMKLVTHRRVMELFPGCGYVETGNAGVNAAMAGVNDQLGYHVVERCLDVQKRLPSAVVVAARD